MRVDSRTYKTQRTMIKDHDTHTPKSYTPQTSTPAMAAGEEENADEDSTLQRGKEELQKAINSKSRELGAKAKDSLTNKICDYRDALQAASSSLSNSGEESSASLVNEYSNQLDGLASHIDERETDELIDEASNAVRAKPMLYLGIAAVAGLALGRILNTALSESQPTGSAETPPSSNPH